MRFGNLVELALEAVVEALNLGSRLVEVALQLGCLGARVEIAEIPLGKLVGNGSGKRHAGSLSKGETDSLTEVSGSLPHMKSLRNRNKPAGVKPLSPFVLAP